MDGWVEMTGHMDKRRIGVLGGGCVHEHACMSACLPVSLSLSVVCLSVCLYACTYVLMNGWMDGRMK